MERVGQPASIITQWCEAPLSRDCGARVRWPPCRSICGRGPVAQPPEIIWEILLPRVHFYNRSFTFYSRFSNAKNCALYSSTSYRLPNIYQFSYFEIMLGSRESLSRGQESIYYLVYTITLYLPYSSFE